MAVVGIVKAIITADTTQFKKGMTDAQNSMARAGANMSKAGKSMTMKVTMPLVGIGLAAGKMASDFEFSMTQIETLVGRSASEVETLKGAVLGLSGETGRAPKELADAMFFITSAGLDAASATAALEMSAKAAAVGLGDTSVVADAVTNAMNGYGMAADGAAFATDVLAKTVEQGKASAADLAPQFGRLIPMAAELGISFDQVGGGLAFLTRSSGDAALSATQLGGVMKSILKPSQQALKTFNAIGVDLGSLRAAASEDLLGALQGLRASLEANGKEMGDVFEDIRGLNGALMLTGKATGQAREVFDQLADSSGKLEEAFEGVQKTAQFKMTQAMSEVKMSMVTLGGAILPVIVPILRTLASIISTVANQFAALPGPVKTVVVILGVLLAAAGPLLMIAGSLVTAWGTLGLTAAASVAPIGAATAATSTLGAAAAATTLSLSAVLLPLLAIVAVAAAVFAVWKHFSNNAKEAQERTDLLRVSFINAENEAGAFKGELEGLRGELDALNAASDAAAEGTNGLAHGFGEIESSGLLLAELIKADVRPEFNRLFRDMDHHNKMMKDGKQGYEDLADGLRSSDYALEQNIALIRDHSEILGEDTERMVALVTGMEGGVDVLKDMLYALDNTADANANLAKENKKLAEAWLDDIDNTVAYVQALAGVKDADGNRILDLIALAEQEGRYVDAATLAIDATAAQAVVAANAAAEAEKQAGAQAGVVSMLVQTSEAFQGTEIAQEHYTQEMKIGDKHADMFAESSAGLNERLVSLAAILPSARDRIAQMNANIEAGIDPLGRYGEELRAINQEAASADRALMQFASGGQAVTDALEFDTTPIKQTYPIYEAMVAEAEALAAELVAQEAALQALKDAKQQEIDLQERSLALAEKKLAELEAQAEAARAPVEAMKEQAAAERQGFEALRGMRDAQNDLADATQTVADIEAELVRVREGGGEAIKAAEQAYRDQMQVVTGFLNDQTDAYDRQQDLIGQIADLTEERASIEQAGGNFQRELLHNLNEQVLAYHDITASVADLEGKQQELSAEALQSQRDLVTSLQAQQAAITEVEQALIDLGIVSATDAAQADISAKQAKNLIKLRDGLEDTEAAVEAGEATLLDLIEAQDDYNKAVKDARRPIDKLERATRDLSRMEKDATRIGLQLAVARDKQTIAQEALTAAQETGARTAEAKDVIDRQLLVLEEQKTAAIEEHEIATDNYTTALEEANKIKDTTAIKDAELERLTRELEDAQWDLVASQYGVRDAEIALAEAGDKVNDAISRMRLISPDLADEMFALSAAARFTYPEFDTMRARLLELEPQIATAKTAIDGFKDAIAALVAQMEILNRTKVTVDVSGKVTTTTPSGGGGGGGDAPAGGGGDAPAADAPVVCGAGMHWNGQKCVANKVAGVTGPDSTKEDLVAGIVVKTAEQFADQGWEKAAEILHERVQAVDHLMSEAGGGYTAQDISDFLATLPSAATGGFVKSAGLVNVHAGETITPGGGATYITVNVEGSVSSERDLVESIRRGLLRAQQSGKAVVLN